MTLKDLLSGQPTLDQLEILQRADNLILARNSKGERIGRYYGGQLKDHQLQHLTLEKPHHDRTIKT